MRFSVIIPVFRDWSRLKLCVSALQNQSFDSDEFEIIVVSNNTEEQIPDIAELSHHVEVKHQPIPGSYAARNMGAQSAIGDVLAFTDSDCIPDPDWLLNADKSYRKERCDLIGGSIHIFKPKDGKNYAFIYDRETAFQQFKNVPKGNSVTANLFVKLAVFKNLEGFNSELKSGGDWEFTQRCVKSGYCMKYKREVRVLHPANRNLREILQKQRRLACWGSLNVRREYGHSQLRILASHIFNGIKKLTAPSTESNLNLKKRATILGIDVIIYIYKILIYLGIFIKVIQPEKVRE